MRGKMMKGLCILVGLLIALTLQVQLAHAQKTTFEKKRGSRCKRALTAFDRGCSLPTCRASLGSMPPGPSITSNSAP